jgi:hypothetical protein
MNADDFGTLKLVDVEFTSASSFLHKEDPLLSLYPNPVRSCFTIEFGNDYQGGVELRIFNMAGKEVSRACNFKTSQDFKAVYEAPQNEGLYFVRIICGQEVFSETISVMQE